MQACTTHYYQYSHQKNQPTKCLAFFEFCILPACKLRLLPFITRYHSILVMELLWHQIRAFLHMIPYGRKYLEAIRLLESSRTCFHLKVPVLQQSLVLELCIWQCRGFLMRCHPILPILLLSYQHERIHTG
ncbi:hypothetical protein RSAG8_05823, partial [Rhizoctonia solani AG-8 WAC10335]